MTAALPSGTVTFLLTDIEGSTLLWEANPAEMESALERHDRLVRDAVAQRNGYVFSTAGDAFAAAFATPSDAVAAATEAQQAMEVEPWPESTPIRVRMGIHTGVAQERDGDYFGPAVNRAARIMAAGHGAQVLVSAAVAALIDDASLVDLGEHRLKDLAAKQRLFQVGDRVFPPLRSLEGFRHNLPVERTPLLGRTEDIGDLIGLIGDHRLVTLLGIGGTGKTRLAGAVAAEVAERFSNGVWFVDLVPATSMDQVVEAIAATTGLQVSGNDRVEALAELMDDREMLVVLDNCEHLTDDVADVVDLLLEHTTSPRFIATSREPLQLLGERLVYVSPLEVEGVSAPAVELFNATAERVDARVGADEAELVGRICSQLDGLPLSIELAASQLRHLTIDELSGRLDQRFELLARGRGRRHERQSSLLAVLADTWSMLDDTERTLLLQLAAFPSAFGADDVEQVCNDTLRGRSLVTLAGLVDRGLVARGGAGRHRLLETVKLFARQQWAHATDGGRFLDRHVDWVLNQFRQRSQSEWYTSYSLENWAHAHHDDIRAVEDLLVTQGRLAELSDLLAGQTMSYTFTTGTRASALIDRVERYLDELPLDDHQRGVILLLAASAGLQARRPDWMQRGANGSVEALRRGGTNEELASRPDRTILDDCVRRLRRGHEAPR